MYNNFKEAITQKFTEYLWRAEEIQAVLDDGGPGPASNGKKMLLSRFIGSFLSNNILADYSKAAPHRRTDRTNEKMRALREVIPNCNKVDKASMLDEATEYLKTLQLQTLGIWRSTSSRTKMQDRRMKGEEQN